ncbi:hypothetical protein [Frankia sp. Cas4]|uniref:hypothetical protein n=1 Tax=Frankia sp. Cas4 TaxID=3073927 RepID=UPI002AD2F893|nr:hypothetical protein [Frankia sp. Cas4]
MPTPSDYDWDPRPIVPPSRPATVWPCPPTDPDQRPAGWLQAAVERIVATATRPGDRVLLLTEPPPADAGPLDDTDDDDTSEELTETAWTVARLGRAVRVRTAPADPTAQRSGSGPGPGLASGPGPDADRHAVVVTVVAPTRLGWFTRIAWGGLLTPDGTLAVVTRSDSRGGWLIDSTIELTAAAGRSGLALLDRIVLLEVPLGQLDRPATPVSRGVVAQRVHSDLLLLGAVGTSASSEKLKGFQPEPKCPLGSSPGLGAWVRGDSSGSVS